MSKPGSYAEQYAEFLAEPCTCGNSPHCVRCSGYIYTEDILGQARTFASGATRDTDTSKIDPEAYLSPLVIRAYCEYMRTHQVQSDGAVRAGDNWQKGMPRDAYMKSMWRHFLDVWEQHREVADRPEEALCALLFNVMGMLHEVLLERDAE